MRVPTKGARSHTRTPENQIFLIFPRKAEYKSIVASAQLQVGLGTAALQGQPGSWLRTVAARDLAPVPSVTGGERDAQPRGFSQDPIIFVKVFHFKWRGLGKTSCRGLASRMRAGQRWARLQSTHLFFYKWVYCPLGREGGYCYFPIRKTRGGLPLTPPPQLKCSKCAFSPPK